MTSGNVTRDETFAVSTQAGNGWQGNKFVKIWTGTNNPPTRPVKEYFYVSLPYVDRRGHPIYTRHRVRQRHAKPARARNMLDHPYNCTLQQTFDYKTTIKVPPGTTYTTTVQLWYGAYSVGGSHLQRWTTNDDLALLGKLRVAIVGTDFNVANFIAEGHQSLRMVTNAATRIFNMYSHLRRGNVAGAVGSFAGVSKSDASRASRSLGTLAKQGALSSSQALLELRYGWYPLLQDAYEGAVWLANMLSVPLEQKYVVRRKIRASLNPSSTMNFEKPDFYTAGQIIARMREVDVAALSGLSNPVSTAWELVPFSFVADWFIPIGSYLDARALARSLTGTFVTTKKIQAKGAAAIGINGTAIAGKLYRLTKTTVDRKVSTTLSVPLPAVKPFSQSLSFVHAQNAVALLTTGVLGGRKPQTLRPDFTLYHPTGAS